MEKQVIAELSSELALASNQDVSWERVIECWEKDEKLGVLRRYNPTTITDIVAGLRKRK